MAVINKDLTLIERRHFANGVAWASARKARKMDLSDQSTEQLSARYKVLIDLIPPCPADHETGTPRCDAEWIAWDSRYGAETRAVERTLSKRFRLIRHTNKGK